MTCIASLHTLADEQLITTVKRLAHEERHATVNLIAALAEIERRQLFLGEGVSSLFVYCTQVLYLAEHSAYNRIAAARAAARWPIILEHLGEGLITLSTLRLLIPHMRDDTVQVLLVSARHKSKREVEQQMAALRPQPDAPAMIRRLPEPKKQTSAAPSPEALGDIGELTLLSSNAAGLESSHRQLREIATVPTPAESSHRPAIVPLAPERYKVQFTVSRECHDRLRRVQDLMRHTNPTGDPGVIFDRALALLLVDLDKRKLASAAKPVASGERPTPVRIGST